MRRNRFVLFLAMVFLFSINLHSQNEPVAKVDFLIGKATMVNKEKKKSVLKKGTALFGGETIITDSKTTLRLRLKNNSLVRIMPGSTIIMNEVKFGQDADRYAFGVVNGGMESKVSKVGQKDYYKVYGPTTVAGVRGTEFLVAVGVNGKTDVMVKEGAVSLDGDQRRDAVKAGEKVEVGLTDEPKKEQISESNFEKEYQKFQKENEKVENPGETIGAAGEQLKKIEENNKKKLEQLKGKENLTEEEQDELDFLYQRSVNQSRSLYYLSETLFKKHRSNTLAKRNFYQVQKSLSSIEDQISDMDQFIEAVSKEIDDFTDEVSEDIDDLTENFGKGNRKK